jgi:hypothetical protein
MSAAARTRLWIPDSCLASSSEHLAQAAGLALDPEVHGVCGDELGPPDLFEDGKL